VDLKQERMMIVKKLIALVLCVGLLTLAVGCPGGPDTSKKTGTSTAPSGGGAGDSAKKSTP